MISMGVVGTISVIDLTLFIVAAYGKDDLSVGEESADRITLNREFSSIRLWICVFRQKHLDFEVTTSGFLL
jgi:hypothetical protein